MTVITRISDAELDRLAKAFCEDQQNEDLDLETAIACFTNRVHSNLASRTSPRSGQKIEIDLSQYPLLKERIRTAITRVLNRRTVSQDYQMTPSPHSGYSPQYLEKLALQFLRKNNPKNLTSAIQAFTQEIRSSLSSRPSLSPRSDSKLKEPIETAMTTAFKRWQNEKKASPASQPLQNANALETCRLDKLKQAIGQSLFQTVAALRALKHDSRM